ncbi:MAG: glycoside hydrolase family protein [Muribaculaceae bacterium]|nr:glycoside hydrolase family protein [Muribaculaceae bacterium]
MITRKFNSTRSSLRQLFWGVAVALFLVISGSPGVLGAAVKTAQNSFSPEFEKAVAVIKKYEGLHKNKGSLIGYGHKVVAGDKYKSGANLTEAQADKLLREDLRKLCAKYRSFGKDSLLLSALAYNCGIGVVAKSSVYKKLSKGNRNIKSSYLSYNRARGKVLSQLSKRRKEEFETLFIP